MKKTTITSIIIAAFSLVAFEAAQAEEQTNPKDWEVGPIAAEAKDDKNNIIKVGTAACPSAGCESHNKGGEQASDASFPEGAVGRIRVDENQ